jgi:predicted nucleotidyltransferase
MAELMNLEKLSGPARELVVPYVHEMIGLLGENVKSVVVFGSAIGKDFIPKKSNINLLVVCERVNLVDLKKSLKLVSEGRKRGIVAPLFLTKTHMETSSDVFPIEFLEMKDFHTVIYGEETFDSLDIGTENLRLECEEQLKGKLIRLRQAYLEIGTNARQMGSVLTESLTSLIPVFRGILRLREKEISLDKEKVIQAVGEEFGVEKGVFLQALAIKAGKKKVSREEIEDLFGRFLAELEGLAIGVDELQRGAG